MLEEGLDPSVFSESGVYKLAACDVEGASAGGALSLAASG